MPTDCSPSLNEDSQAVLIKIIEARFITLLEQAAQCGFVHRRDFYAVACRSFRLDRDTIKQILRNLEAEGIITQDARGIRVLKQEGGEHG